MNPRNIFYRGGGGDGALAHGAILPRVSFIFSDPPTPFPARHGKADIKRGPLPIRVDPHLRLSARISLENSVMIADLGIPGRYILRSRVARTRPRVFT